MNALIESGNRRSDAVPVVRGEWVLVGTNEHDYETSVEEKCSLCGRYVYRYDTQPQDNFCPNCGADMRRKRGQYMIYAVDFDGTLCTNAWPDIGEAAHGNNRPF